ncbi:Protein CBG16282 [Caenorhabditis briggsae]|uniref:Protein CBG16282 n=1 Tax=Caenorhabditis briggsae TaxID=6238 RepID=A8XNR3_CAEBR|nr:Protein CBG16282 [Caenorhabditis briggsae]CAP34152.1 Protein CBG16282 [Caenorhabditis briggsae]
MARGCPFTKKTKRAPKKSATSITGDGENNVVPNMAPKKIRKPRDENQWKITDFYEVRKSGRKTEKQLQDEAQKAVAEKVLKGSNEELLQVFHDADKGRCICSTVNFQKDEFVIEYKDKAVRYLASQKENTKYTFYFKKLILSENRIVFTYLVFGFGNGKNTMVLEFDPKSGQLNYGYNQQCIDY